MTDKDASNPKPKPKAKRKSGGSSAFGRFLGLLVLLGVIGGGVYGLIQYHYSKGDQYQNEMFFGDSPEEDSSR